MQVIGILEMAKFLDRHPDLNDEVDELIRDIETNRFSSMEEMRQRYPSMKTVDGKTVVFKVRGNKFRLSAKVNFVAGALRIIALETHAAYDRRDLRK